MGMLLVLSLFFVSGCSTTNKRVIIYIEKGKSITAPVDGFFIDKGTMMDLGTAVGQSKQ